MIDLPEEIAAACRPLFEALPLEQAIRKITSLPAQRERLRDRGLLKEGFFADITIFDPTTIIDKATYENPAGASK